jgi:hypothetical protein
MIGHALQLGHQRPQPDCARRNVDGQSRLDGLRERQRIGNGAVARGATGKLRAALDIGAGHQRLDAFMHVTEPLFEPRHSFAIGGEAEVSGLDDAGMNRADRDLMQILALDRKKLVGARLNPRRLGFAERLSHAPEAEIEPRPCVRRADRLQAIETSDRALEPTGRGMPRRHRRELAVGTFEREHADFARRFFEQREMHGAMIAPQTEHGRAGVHQMLHGKLPSVARDHDARPGAVGLDPPAFVGNVRQCRHGIIIQATSPRSGTKPRAAAANRYRR